MPDENEVTEQPDNTTAEDSESVIDRVLRERKDPDELPKRKRGRPSKADKMARAQESAQEIDISNIAVFYDGIFATIAFRLGNHWLLTEAEKDALGKATRGVIVKYADKLADYVPLIFFFGTVLAIVLPRLMAQSEIKKAQAAENTPTGAGVKT